MPEGGIRVEPVSGLGEMGAHHMLVDVGPVSFALDCGVLFPTPWDVGVDHLAPSFEPLLARGDRLQALLLTHGHRDHIGAVGHLLARRPELPVYGTRFTLALLRRVLDERGVRPDTRVVEASQRVEVAGVGVTWHPVTHSLPEACSVSLESSLGTVVHSGDFRIQPDPFLGPPTDSEGLRALGDRGVDLALVDSTGAARPGRTLSEREVADHLVGAVSAVPGLVVVTAFSSHVERVAACIRAAVETGRTPALYGRSLEATVATARDLGLFGGWGRHLRSVDAVARLGNRGLIVATGTQGEWRAPLARMARGEDSRVKLGPGDAVLWSARAIPGNDRAIGMLVNRFVDRGVSVTPPWGQAARSLHTSGHGLRDEVAEWLGWVRPRCVVPIHGEAWHLAEHRRVLQAAGEDPSSAPGGPRILSLRSGDAVEFGPGRLPTLRSGEARGFHAAVGRDLWSPDEPSLRDLRRIARTGVITAVVDGDRVGVVSVGVYPAAQRPEREAELAAAVRDVLDRATAPRAVEDRRELIRLTLRRAAKAHTGERVECAVRISDPGDGN